MKQSYWIITGMAEQARGSANTYQNVSIIAIALLFIITIINVRADMHSLVQRWPIHASNIME